MLRVRQCQDGFVERDHVQPQHYQQPQQGPRWHCCLALYSSAACSAMVAGKGGTTLEQGKEGAPVRRRYDARGLLRLG